MILRAGWPATMVRSGTSPATTEPGSIPLCLPIWVPGMTKARDPTAEL